MADEAREEWLREHQEGRVYPLGRALRDTYSAENHDSLGGDVAGLMIGLSQVPSEPEAARLPEPPPLASTIRPSILTRLTGMFHR